MPAKPVNDDAEAVQRVEPDREVSTTTQPGLLLLGILLVPLAILFNPYFLDWLWPPLLAYMRDWWWPTLSLHLLLLVLVIRAIAFRRTLAQTALAKLMFERHAWIGGGVISLSILTVFMLGVEVVFAGLNAYRESSAEPGLRNRHVPSIAQPDPFLAGRNNIAGVYEHLCIDKESRIPEFKKTYTLKDDGTRLVPQPNFPKTHHVALFGCSFTFGTGADDHETWAASLAAQVPDAQVYNFGVPGYAPSQVYLMLELGSATTIKEPRGVAFYRLFHDHIARMLPRIRYATTWTRDYPAFRLNGDGKPQYIGTLSGAYPWRLNFLHALKHEHFLRWSGLDFPTGYSEDGVKLCLSVLSAARDAYRKQFPGNEFYVILEPDSRAEIDAELLKKCVAESGLTVLDASSAYPPGENQKFYYPRDGHPTPLGNVHFANWLVEQFPNGFLAPPSAGNSMR
jgi:hypothetical protein